MRAGGPSRATPAAAGAILGALACAGCMAKGGRPLVVAPEPRPSAPDASPRWDPARGDTPLPTNPLLRSGHLANGLTYYVLPHARGQGRASLSLVVRAGWGHDPVGQGGAAHLVEHMAFRGTRRFPRRAGLEEFQRAGMDLGPDVSGETTLDHTQYRLTVPAGDGGLLTRGLDYLRDVAADLTFDEADVALERAIVREEWRTRRNATARMAERERPLLLAGTRFEGRATPGTPASIGQLGRAELLQFYRLWYRPGTMAVIAVGDFEPAAIEQEIRARFTELVRPAAPVPAPPLSGSVGAPAQAGDGVSVMISTDPEAPATTIEVLDKIPRRPDATRADFRRRLIDRLYALMQSARIASLCLESDSPLLEGATRLTSVSPDVEAVKWSVTAKESAVPAAVALVFGEMARNEQHEFEASELERSRAVLLSRLERHAAEHDKSPLSERSREIVRVFLYGEGILGPTEELRLARELLPSIRPRDVAERMRAWNRGAARVVTVRASRAESLPTEDEIRRAIAVARETRLPPWNDGTETPPSLMRTRPLAGRVVSARHDDAADATVWMLANGVRVVVKPTTLSNDRIAVAGWQPGGISVLPEADVVGARVAGAVAQRAGLDGLDPGAIDRVLHGRDLAVSVGLEENLERVRAEARGRDLELMLQALHLRLTRPGCDRPAFERWKARWTAAELRRRETPEGKLSVALEEATFGGDLRRTSLSPADVAKVELERACAIWRERFGDLGDFTFAFVGRVDPAVLQPLVETYLGSLPSRGRRERAVSSPFAYPTAKVERVVSAGREPKSLLWVRFLATLPWSLDAQRDCQALQMLLKDRMFQRLRVEGAGTYAPHARVRLTRGNAARATVDIRLATAPENVEHLRAQALDELEAVSRGDIDDDELAKLKERLRQQHASKLKHDAWWLEALFNTYLHGDDFAAQLDIEAAVRRIDRANLAALAKRLFDRDKVIAVVVQPEGTGAPAASQGR